MCVLGPAAGRNALAFMQPGEHFHAIAVDTSESNRASQCLSIQDDVHQRQLPNAADRRQRYLHGVGPEES